MKKLCLDLSTTHCGFCIFEDGKFVEAGCVDLSSKDSIFERLDIVSDFILKKCAAANIKNVYIEKYVLAYKRSSITTIVILANFIETIRYLLYKNSIETFLVSAATVRKKAGIKLPKETNRQVTKDFILSFIKNKISEEQCSILYETKKTGNPKDHCYDTADAVIIAMGT